MKQHNLNTPWTTPPAAEETLEVAPGVHWLRLPLPTQLNHVNVYILEDKHGIVLFDTGYNTPENRAIWDTVLSRFSLGERPRILCSHYHPDHFGLVGYLCETYGFELLMSQTEWLIANLLNKIGDQYTEEMDFGFFRSHGMQDSDFERHSNRSSQYRAACTGCPASYTQVSKGETLHIGEHQWEVITAAGHSPEQVCLHSASTNVLLSADHILPRITPNTSVFSFNPGANPLKSFLDSFRDFAHIDDQTLALPCHNLPFYGVATRIAQLASHHEERLVELTSLCETPQHAYGLVAKMFTRALDPLQEVFALGEVIAHLKLLQSRGELRASLQEGVYYFQQN